MKVTFQKKFPYAPYLNLDIGAEGECEDNKEAFFNELDKLNDWCNEWFKTRYGVYEEQRGTVEKIIPVTQVNKAEVFIAQNDYGEKSVSEPLSKEDRTISEINSCKELKVLESYKFIAKMNPKFQEAYDEKLKQLK